MRYLQKLNVPLCILALVAVLLTTGLIGVYSSSATLAGREIRAAQQRADPLAVASPKYHASKYLQKQLFWAALGLVAMTFFYHFDYRLLKRGSFWIMALCFLACALVWMPGIGREANGANRWIRFGPIGLQPSEFAKLGLIIYMAKMLDDRHRYIKSFFSGVFPAMVVAGAFAAIIVLEPDFGSAFVLCLVIFGMWLCGEMRWFHLGGLLVAAIPAAALAFVLQPYRIRRMFAFFSDDPEVLLKEGYQLHQSLIAVGSGGWNGLGLGAGIQKHDYLFAGHNDFIFAILAEELGFYRTSLIIVTFAALVALGFWVALNTSDLFGSLLATGITLMVTLGATIHMGVNLGLLPTKGLVLPFMSYGGSSLLVLMASMGILMNIADRQFGLIEKAAPARGRRRRYA